jgi:8-oxo-dGTP pyrophosphatase MutT (NUDIX family)
MDEVLFQSDWLAIKTTPGGYEYMSQMKSDEGVAVLAFRRNPLQFVGRYEEIPPHRDGIALCSLTGMVDAGEHPTQTAVRELFEEAGIQVGYDEMMGLGSVRPSKASDYVIHIFAVDIGDRDIGRGPGDGTQSEKDAYCQWIDYDEAIESKDPTLATSVARLEERYAVR